MTNPSANLRDCPMSKETSTATAVVRTGAMARTGIVYIKSRFPIAVLLLMFLATGCGYAVGPTHDLAITSIEVPTFKNSTFRRGIEQQLTEAVQKEIQTRTSMRLVRGAGAQTRLTGRIVSVGKQVLGETAFDDPRELQLGMVIEVQWDDLQNGGVLRQRSIQLDSETVALFTQSDFAPEVGHSLATAVQSNIKQTARQIVDMMDEPW
jgi:hypothetical protein